MTTPIDYSPPDECKVIVEKLKLLLPTEAYDGLEAAYYDPIMDWIEELGPKWDGGISESNMQAYVDLGHLFQKYYGMQISKELLE